MSTLFFNVMRPGWGLGAEAFWHHWVVPGSLSIIRDARASAWCASLNVGPFRLSLFWFDKR